MVYKQPDSRGHFEEFGGKYVPETLIPAITELENLYIKIRDDADFKAELSSLLKHYSGRPTPLYYAKRISDEMGYNVYLKREDLQLTRSFKIRGTYNKITQLNELQ